MHATAPLTIAIALTAGIFVQILAFHLRIPAIVLLNSEGPLFLPLLVFRSKRRFVVDERWSARTGDEILVALVPARAEEARAALAACGWKPVSPVSP